LKRERLDRVLVSRTIIENIDEARTAIDKHRVHVNGSIATSHGYLIAPSDEIRVVAGQRYVSRGGQKLEAALSHFEIDLTGKRVLDAGASTGGFTDCALQHGARQVVALDVGRNLLHERLIGDARVVEISETNVREIDRLVKNKLPNFVELFDVVVADLSFISLVEVMGSLLAALNLNGDLILHVKPQFEASQLEADKGAGVITDPTIHKRVCQDVSELATQSGCLVRGIIESPIRGHQGNIEFLLVAKYTHPANSSE